MRFRDGSKPSTNGARSIVRLTRRAEGHGLFPGHDGRQLRTMCRIDSEHLCDERHNVYGLPSLTPILSLHNLSDVSCAEAVLTEVRVLYLPQPSIPTDSDFPTC